ncbi:hypothetical protein POM88_021213 [Heracleum sosnowskyi]|uniref:Uncharacterized protein n=1 Tax=Heracleum sosnowskyi TaxID=360622 RepID=A0AAD8MTK4_9APIA|nr:hypothetical protein POM88_021213 [Heracleum sosnowskyi]
MITPTSTDLHVAHLCVLQNTTAVGLYFAEHMAFLLTRYPEHENDEMWLKNKQNETFPKWFKEKIASDLVDGKEVPQEISPSMYELANARTTSMYESIERSRKRRRRREDDEYGASTDGR